MGHCILHTFSLVPSQAVKIVNTILFWILSSIIFSLSLIFSRCRGQNSNLARPVGERDAFLYLSEPSPLGKLSSGLRSRTLVIIIRVAASHQRLTCAFRLRHVPLHVLLTNKYVSTPTCRSSCFNAWEISVSGWEKFSALGLFMYSIL
jgi:hypothetical protein